MPPIRAEGTSSAKRARQRRFVLLALLAVLGATLFVPFFLAGAPGPVSGSFPLGFVVAASLVAAVATWLGLGWADQAALPMPLLRQYEARAAIQVDRKAVLTAVVAGVVVGVAGIIALRVANVPSSAGSFPVRAASAFFAAITLESVLHLAIMSVVVRATRNVTLGIAVATVAYIGFHMLTLGGQPATVVLTSIVGNGIAGLVFGWLYAKFGYEYLILAHFVAHVLAVGLA